MSQFPPSPWTLLAHHASEKLDRTQTLDTLYRLYARPVYAFISREYPQADAGDVTQEVFVRLMRGNDLLKADRTRGKLRTYLISIIRSVAWKEWKSSEPRRANIPLDADEFEGFAGRVERPGGLEACEWLDLLCARDAMERAFRKVHASYIQRSKAEAYEILRQLCIGDPVPDAAMRMGCSEGALRVQLHRFRVALNQGFRAEVALMGGDPRELDQEARHLLDLLARMGTGE